jgi:hypothetical protein
MINWLKKIFKKDTAAMEKPEAPEAYTVADKVQHLQRELTKITAGYGANIRKLQAEYNTKQEIYETVYRAYAAGLTAKASDTELAELQQVQADADEQLRDAGAELDTVRGYLQADTLQILNELEQLQGQYTTELAASIEYKAARLQALRAEYLNTISSIGKAYRQAQETENMLSKEYQKLNKPYHGTISKELSLRTHGLPITAHALIIEQHEINSAMKQGRYTPVQ